MITFPPNKKKLKISRPHDPDSKKLYGFMYKPPVFAAGVAYRKDLTAVLPSTFNGFYYAVSSNGISSTEPTTWATEKGELTTSGTVTFKAVEYTLFLGDAETITASTWSITDSIPLTLESYTPAGTTQVMVGNIPAGVKSFTLTNHVTKSTGEEEDHSLVVSVGDR